jgi:hypothetical protein
MSAILKLPLTCVLLCGLASCETVPGSATGPRPGQTVVNAFAPASIRVHPLTHLDRDADGRPMILLHLELRDSWGDACKAVGTVVVELYRPSQGVTSGLERQELVWEIDLSDLDINRTLFDPATRTYRFQLTDLPGWVTVDPNDVGSRRLRLNAVLTTTGVSGEQAVYDDSYVLRY